MLLRVHNIFVMMDDDTVIYTFFSDGMGCTENDMADDDNVGKAEG